MAVITSRQQGLRPETIRTRLARFMPSRAATGWSVAWSAATDHADEIADELELRTAEHLACYGTVVGHALAQSDLFPQRLRITADSSAADDGTPIITIEVRAQIGGPAVDQALFDAIVQRAEPTCPVLKGLASEASMRLIAILDDSLASQAAAPAATTQTTASAPRPNSSASKSHAQTTAPAAATTDAATASDSTPEPAAAKPAKPALSEQGLTAMTAMRLPSTAGLGKMSMPKWMTPRFAVMLVVGFGAVARLTMMVGSPA